MNPTARTLPTSRATTTATMNPTWPGTSFRKITLRLRRGSTNGFTAWQTTPPMCENSGKLISISSSRSLCSRRPLTTGGIDERAPTHPHGNPSTTRIGAYGKPKRRLPGSGGACEISINAQRTFMIMRLKRRAFVDKVDFLTSPGHLTGGDSRAQLGLPGGGPELVITDKAILNFADPQREMQLSALYPGVTGKDVQAEVGWPLRVAESIQEADVPTNEELRLIREELDPHGMYR